MKKVIVLFVIVVSISSSLFATGVSIFAIADDENVTVGYALSSGGEPEDEEVIEIFRQEVDLNGNAINSEVLIRTVEDAGATFTDYLNGSGYIWDNGTKNFIFLIRLTPENYVPGNPFNPIIEDVTEIITITRTRITPISPPNSSE